MLAKTPSQSFSLISSDLNASIFLQLIIPPWRQLSEKAFLSHDGGQDHSRCSTNDNHEIDMINSHMRASKV